MAGNIRHALKTVFLGSLFLITHFCNGQLSQRSEFGFGAGAFNYTGDLVRNYNILNSKPAGTVFYRNNISKVVSFRTSLTGGRCRPTSTAT